ncbi:MAG TPA: PQQ-binding-like beta-propeller repeat protein, partial [Candidatus Dormibacteraeota bacterium]|nr:PQQ-binding-like beta-propeller repeat protein [Candidatus Dormibacteraeota bacterium]
MTLCLLAACSDPSPHALGPAWPEYRGDLARDGHPPAATLTAAGARVLARTWSAHLDGAVDGTPAVDAAKVIVGTSAGSLYALDRSTGKTIWSKHGVGAISSSPAIAGDSVYVTTLTGHTLAFGLERGNLRWDWSGD